MKAIILAAGYATRLYPLTLTVPKPLLLINKKPIIDYIMDEIVTIPEIDQVFVVSNHKFAPSFDEWAKNSSYDIEIKIIDDGTSDVETRLGAIGDILFTIEKENINEEMVIIAGDNLFTFSLKEYYNYYKEKDRDCVCVKQYHDKKTLSQFGIALLGEDNRVLEIEEKPENPKSDMVVYAAYMYKKETVDLFKKYLEEGNKPDAPGNFAQWLAVKKEVYAFTFEEECYDIGTPESLKEVFEIMEKIENSKNKKIGFIGTGVMGRHMVRNLMKKGFLVSVYNRTKESADEIVKEGAIWCDSIAECAKDKDAVITIVGYPKDVEEVYFGEKGILDSAKEGAYVIDMTTTSPKVSEKIYVSAKEKGIKALDAPVSGGDTGAKNGTLAIMVGGDKTDFDQVKGIFDAMGTNVIYEGGAGCGQHVKMANQIAIAGAVCGVAEAVKYGQKMGLDIETMLSTISGGAAGSWQMNYNGAKMSQNDFSAGFYIKHFIKDMKIALDEAGDKNLELSVLADVCNKFVGLEEKGMGDLGTQAIIKAYKDNN